MKKTSWLIMILQGMNRERAPFVLTPDFEYVLGKRVSEMFVHVEPVCS